MEEFGENSIQWWWTHSALLAGFVLFLCSLLTFYFPLMVQRRLPKLTLVELTTQYPNLRWLKWGHLAWFLGTVLLTVPGGVFLFQTPPRLSDEQGIFLMTALFCMSGLSTGVLALWTGVYRGMGSRWFSDDYYRVAESKLSWIPLTQIIVALAIAVLSLAGFFAR